MAQINPLSTAMRLTLSLGQEDGETRTKSISISNMNVDADADTLLTVSTALGTLMEHPVLETKRSALGLVVE